MHDTSSYSSHCHRGRRFGSKQDAMSGHARPAIEPSAVSDGPSAAMPFIRNVATIIFCYVGYVQNTTKDVQDLRQRYS